MVLVNELTDEELLEFGVNNRVNPFIQMGDRVHRSMQKMDKGKLDEEDALEMTLELVDFATGLGAENLKDIGEAGLEMLDNPNKESAGVLFGMTPNQSEKAFGNKKKKKPII